VGTDIFTEKNYEDMAPSSHNIYVPIVVKNELALLDINSDGYLTMMNDEGE
jgi:translation initiation factor 5A